MDSSVCALLPAGLTIGVPASAAPDHAAMPDSASIALTKTVTASAVKAALGCTPSANTSAVIPGDVLTYAATVANRVAAVIVAGSHDEVECFSKTANRCLLIAGGQAASLTYTMVEPSRATTRMSLMATLQPADGATRPASGDQVLDPPRPEIYATRPTWRKPCWPRGSINRRSTGRSSQTPSRSRRSRRRLQ